MSSNQTKISKTKKYQIIKMLSRLAVFLLVTCLSANLLKSLPIDHDPLQILLLPSDIDPTKLSYKLSFLWPQGYCKTKSSGCEKATNLPNHFTMHGFWPIYKGKCDDSTEKFSIDKVSDIKDSLEKNWPDLKNYRKPEKYVTFWDHEWIAHGTRCALYSVHDYFDHSLKLLADSKVTEIIEQAGKPTKPEDVKKLFIGKEPYVRCKNGSDGKSYFFQLEFCLDGSEKYVNCPKITDKTLCPDGKDFYYG